MSALREAWAPAPRRNVNEAKRQALNRNSSSMLTTKARKTSPTWSDVNRRISHDFGHGLVVTWMTCWRSMARVNHGRSNLQNDTADRHGERLQKWLRRHMDGTAAMFGDQTLLAEHLLAALGTEGNDGSHDRSHLLRVWRNAQSIAEHEQSCDLRVLAAAVILHDCVAVEKNSPLRSQASRLAAERARVMLANLDWDEPLIEATAHAIEAHSYSAGIAPRTVEARIVQDADRLDAIGAIGIARCFYVAGRMGSSLYDPVDPSADGRNLDDRRFALDHFGAKLFNVAENFQTKTGQALAEERSRTMHSFVHALLGEIGTGGNA